MITVLENGNTLIICGVIVGILAFITWIQLSIEKLPSYRAFAIIATIALGLFAVIASIQERSTLRGVTVIMIIVAIISIIFYWNGVPQINQPKGDDL